MLSIPQLNHIKLNKWMENKEVQLLNSSDIMLIEPLHKYGKEIKITNNKLEKYSQQESITRTIIVRPYNNGKYALITGYKWLSIAKLVNKPIQAIIVSPKWRHNTFIRNLGLIENNKCKVPDDTELLYPIHKIKVCKRLKTSKPGKEKYNKYEKYYKENGTIDKSITVVQNPNDRNAVIVVDEYIRFLILKNNGVKYIPVKFLNIEERRLDEK